MLKKFAPRSGSSVSTAATLNCASPRRTVSPGPTASAEVSRSSSQTVPGCGPPSANPSGALRRGAMRSLPRSGYDALTALIPASRLRGGAEPAAVSPLVPACAMLMKLELCATASPRRAISAAIVPSHGWSLTMSRSPPSSWCASRLSPCRTRSAKNDTLVTLPTAISSASASTRSSPARQSRASMRRASAIKRSSRRPGARCGRSAARAARRGSPSGAWCRPARSART